MENGILGLFPRFLAFTFRCNYSGKFIMTVWRDDFWILFVLFGMVVKFSLILWSRYEPIWSFRMGLNVLRLNWLNHERISGLILEHNYYKQHLICLYPGIFIYLYYLQFTNNQSFLQTHTLYCHDRLLSLPSR